MIAVDMKMTRKFIYQRGNFEVMNVEHEFSALYWRGSQRKTQAERKILVSLN
jgi:hypothetical protein